MTDSPMNLSVDLARIEDYTTLRPAVRAFLTAKLQGVLDSLEPYMDGTFEMSPRMAEVYLRALREMGLLYRVYDPPRVDPGEEETEAPSPQLALEAVRREVSSQLEELELRTR